MRLSVPALLFMTPATLAFAVEAAPAPAPAPAAAEGAAEATSEVTEGSLNNVDVRLILGSNNGITNVRNDATDTEVDYDSTGGGTFAVHVLYVRALPHSVGFAVGGGLFAHSHAGEPETGAVKPETTVSAVGIDVRGAFVYRPTPQWHFELPALVLSAGGATVETDGGKKIEDGSYSQIALQVGAFYTFDFGLQLGAELGGSGFNASFDDEISPGVEQEIQFRGGGAHLNLSVGYRF